MGSLEIRVALANGETRPFDLARVADAKEVVRELCHEGFVVLKDAGHRGLTTGYEEKDIIANKYIHALLAIAQDGQFLITNCSHFMISPTERNFGRSPVAFFNDARLMEVSCNHLGGSKQHKWTIEVNKDRRAIAKGATQCVEMEGLDIILLNGWLLRTNPWPELGEGQRLNGVVVTHMWKVAYDIVEASPK